MMTSRKNITTSGFTLIELLVVLVLLGLTMSLLAPDMYTLLQRVQAKTEMSKIRTLAELSLERSYFSGSDIKIDFVDNRMIISQRNEVEKYQALKEINSEFFIFEKTTISLLKGKWLGSKSVALIKTPSESWHQVLLTDEQ